LDNFVFLQNFFSAYPEYASNPFFVTGESYAGVYVPTLVEQIMIHNNNGQSSINLIGFAVGNGCTGNAVGVCGDSAFSLQTRVDFLHGKGLFDEDLYQQLVANCGDYTNPSGTCYNLLNEMGNKVGDINIYDVYGDCIFSKNSPSKESAPFHRIPAIRDPKIRAALGRIGGPDGCIDGGQAANYLNNDRVRSAIHVGSMAKLGNWTICTNNIIYDGNIGSLLGLYPTLIENYRVLIYNGDVDCCVPYLDNEHWTEGLGYPTTSPWHPWSVNGQVAGYATNYDANGFAFVTVKGAGHMVPETKPENALAMFQMFLAGTPF